MFIFAIALSAFIIGVANGSIKPSSDKAKIDRAIKHLEEMKRNL
jgi:hypothetical protein